MNKLFFTSDTHFNHANVITHSKRPFADEEEMTSELIRRWNETVPPNGVVYHLGDFALSWGSKHTVLVDDILSQLHGDKFLVTGNHDRKETLTNPRWKKVTPYHEIKVDMGRVHKQRIVMCHYAMRTWNQMHRGAWMLHGHSHGNLPDRGGKIVDVGVDVHGYAPIVLDYLDCFMEGRDILTEDHHTPTHADEAT